MIFYYIIVIGKLSFFIRFKFSYIKIAEFISDGARANKAFLIHVIRIRERVFFFSMIVRPAS
jgi:hypothetical protein